MHIIAAYQEVGTYRGAADICGTTHKTVKRVIERAGAGEAAVVARAERPRNYDPVTELVAERVLVWKGADLGETVAAGRPGRGVRGFGPGLPPPGVGAEGVVAQGSSPWSAAGGVDAADPADRQHGPAGAGRWPVTDRACLLYTSPSPRD